MSRRPLPEPGWLATYRKLTGWWTRRASLPQDAEDALQDAAVSLLELDGLAARDEGHYFHRAAVNRAVSLHRANTRRLATLDACAQGSAATVAGADADYEARQLTERMLSALEELPRPCRQAFQLRQLEGLSNAQIAERLGVSRNMVERYMMRTTRHLQDRLLSS